MSTKCFDVYRIPSKKAKDQASLMKFLCDLKKSYMDFLMSSITAERAELAIRFAEYDIEHDIMNAKAEFAHMDKGDYLYFRKYVKRASASDERGVEFDCSGDAFIIQHKGIALLWMFPGFELERFMRRNPLFKKMTNYSYSDQTDGFPSRVVNFWQSLFAERKTYRPTELGLKFSFWNDFTDLMEVASKLGKCYREKHPETK